MKTKIVERGAKGREIMTQVVETVIQETVEVAVETDDAIAALNLKLRDPGEVRRLGRVMLGYQAAPADVVYHGPRTDKFVADVIAAFGFNKENTSPQ